MKIIIVTAVVLFVLVCGLFILALLAPPEQP